MVVVVLWLYVGGNDYEGPDVSPVFKVQVGSTLLP